MAERKYGVTHALGEHTSPPQLEAAASPFLLTRRDVVKLMVLTAGGALATAANVKIMDAPAVTFLFREPYRSTVLPRRLLLTQADVENATEVGVGTSYVKGQGGQPPAKLVAQSVSSADIGVWHAEIAAKSGSFVSDIPDQLRGIDVQNLNGTKIVVTDSGYNSATHHALSVPGLLPELNAVIEEVGQVKIRNAADLLQVLLKAPRLWRRFNNVAEVILHALDKTGTELADILPYILDNVDTDTAFVYEWPPLERVNNLVYIRPEETEPVFRMPIYGDPARELFAKRISELGSGMAEQVIEQVYREKGGRVTLVPIGLRAILPRAVYEKSADEHPTEDGYTNIAMQQMQQTEIDNASLYAEVRRRAR